MIGQFVYSHYLNWDGTLAPAAFRPGALLRRWQLYRLAGEIKSLIEYEREISYRLGYRDATSEAAGA